MRSVATQPASSAHEPPAPVAESSAVTPDAMGLDSQAHAQSGARLLVDDTEAPSAEQLRLGDFLAEVREAVCAAVDELLTARGLSTDNCPYLSLVFPYFESQSAASAEITLRSFDPALGSARSAREYIPIIVERARAATRHWLETGRITGLPENVPASLQLLLDTFGGADGAGDGAGAGADNDPAEHTSVQFKARPGGAHPSGSPEHVQAQLGSGHALDSRLQGRMHAAYGPAISGVRIHTDAAAASLASSMNARAFTVGSNVAFAAGEYRPGTLVGDALIAHELAHVVQQGSAGTMSADPESAADSAAYDALMGRPASPGALGGLKLQRCDDIGSGYDPEHHEEYHHDPPTPEEMIEHYTRYGDLREDELGAELARMAWYTPRHFDFIRRVFDELDDTDRDDVMAAMIQNTPDHDLMEFARNPEGRALLRDLVPHLTSGWDSDSETYDAIRVLRSISAHNTSEGLIAGELSDLQRAVDSATVAADIPIESLSRGQVTERLRLLEERLREIERQHGTNAAIASAITAVRTRLAEARRTLTTDTAGVSRAVQIAEQIVATCEVILTALSQQIANLERGMGGRGTENANLALIRFVRDRYVEALSAALAPDAALKLARASAALQQLPLSQAELELAVLQNQPGKFADVAPKLRAMNEFAGSVITDLRALEAESISIRQAAQRGQDVSARRTAAERKLEGLRLAHRTLLHWSTLINVSEALESGFSFTEVFYGHDVDVDSLHTRLSGMADLARRSDYTTLEQQLTAFENDQEIRDYYEDIPNILRSSGMVVAIGVLIATIVVTWGAGAALGLGAAATTAGGLSARTVATGLGAAALEAVIFTSVHRGLSEISGIGAHGGFFEDLLWNFGLFGILKGTGYVVRTGLQARGLAHLAGRVHLATSFGVLESYGVIRFGVEEGRLPTSAELASMTLQNIVLLAGMSAVSAARARYSALGRFHARWGSRFEALALERRTLEQDALRAMEEGRTSQFQAELQQRARALETRLQALVNEVIAEGNIAALRTELDTMLGMEVSQAALTQSLGLLPEIAARRAGTPDSFSYRAGETARLRTSLQSIGATEVTVAPGEPTVVRARFADNRTWLFVERSAATEGTPAPAPPAPVLSPVESNVVRLEAARDAITRRGLSWDTDVPEALRGLRNVRPRAQTVQRTIDRTARQLGELEAWLQGRSEVAYQTAREARIEMPETRAQAEVARLPAGELRDHLTGDRSARLIYGALHETSPTTARTRLQRIFDDWKSTTQEQPFAEFAESRLIEEGVQALKANGHTTLAELLRTDGAVQNAFGRLGFDTARLHAVHLYYQRGYLRGPGPHSTFRDYLRHEAPPLEREGKSWAERRGNLATEPIAPDGYEPLRTRLNDLTTANALTETDARIVWRWRTTIEALATQSNAQIPNAPSGTARATALLDYLLQGMGNNFSETTYRAFRHRMRGLIVDDVIYLRGGVDTSGSPANHNGTPVRAWAEQLTRLETWEGRSPDSATRGALWAAYANARFGLNLPADSAVAAIDVVPGRKLSMPDRTMGDAVLRIVRRLGGGPPPGDYAGDYKGGADPHSIKQTRVYSTNIISNQGKFVMGGVEYDGLLLLFRDSGAARRAATEINLDTEMTHPANLRVGYFDNNGSITWLR